MTASPDGRGKAPIEGGRLRRWAPAALLVAWVVSLLGLTLVWFPRDHPAPNLVPFRMIAHDWRAGGRSFVVNFAGNIVAFLPLGFLLPLARSRPTHAWQAALSGLAVSGPIELAQYLSGRRVGDVDDLILNATGAWLGYWVLAAFRWARAGRLARAGAAERETYPGN